MAGREIVVGAGEVDESLPKDRLTDEERVELRKLMQVLEEQSSLAKLTQDRIHLLLMAAKDRRGIAGQIKVSVDDGTIRIESGDGSTEDTP